MAIPYRQLLRELQRDARRGVPARKGKPNRALKDKREFLEFMGMWADKKLRETAAAAADAEKTSADAEKPTADAQT